MGAVVLLVGGYVGTQVIGVLFGLIAPPLPPTPPNLTSIDHTSTDYGSDEWLYTSPQHPCDVAQFFIANGLSSSSLMGGSASLLRSGALLVAVQILIVMFGLQRAIMWLVA